MASNGNGRKPRRDYEVGKGKPPKHGQIKKGEVRNPGGRPKGSRNFETEVKDVLKLRVQVSEGGKRKKVSVVRAALLRLTEKALAGDLKAIDRLLEHAARYASEELSEAVSLNRSDAEVLEGFKQRLLRGTGQADPAGRGNGTGEDGTPGSGDASGGDGNGGGHGDGPSSDEEDDDDDAWLN